MSSEGSASLESNESTFRERWTSTPWGQMFSRSSATNPSRSVMILVPGMIISSRYMIPLAKVLMPYGQVHMIDFPGYGRSQKPKHVLSVPELADSLSYWMHSNQISKAILIANSFGCQIAADFAMRYPELVDKLILQGPTVDAEARGVWKQFLRLKRNSWRESKSVGVISFKDYRSAGWMRVLKTIQMTLEDRIEEKLPHVKADTLVVRGTKDLVVPQRWAERVARLTPGARLQLIDGAAHTLNYSEPEKFRKVILEFLDDHHSDGGDDGGR